MAFQTVGDVVVPTIFTPYVQVLTEEKSELVQSGVIVRDSSIDALLAGGGLTFNVPGWTDLANDRENIADDTIIMPYSTNQAPVPSIIGRFTEVGVRLSRNKSWARNQLAADLAGNDPMNAIASRVAYYWTRRLQAAFIATVTGVFNDNTAAPSGTEHVAGDLTLDISGGAFDPGVTDFSAEAYLDAKQLMGDAQGDLSLILCHSQTYNKMLKNDLIDFVKDSVASPRIATFMGARVIVDDGMTRVGNVCHTWLFGPGAVRLGVGTPEKATDVEYLPGAGNGHGAEVLYSRVQWCLHPAGHAYVASSPNGGPDNFDVVGGGAGTLAAPEATTLAHADSWARRYPERKQIKVARLITREA